jgi:hypothetical protein
MVENSEEKEYAGRAGTGQSTSARLDKSRLGSLGKLEDGRSYVRFERHLPFPIETVWAAITDPELLARWFPGITLERKLGGSFEIWFGGECEGPAHVQGTVTAYDPPTLLECGGMRYELQADEQGCRLVFTDILSFDQPGTREEITNSVLGGWHSYMDQLEEALTTGSVDLTRPEPDYALLKG